MGEESLHLQMGTCSRVNSQMILPMVKEFIERGTVRLFKAYGGIII
jgi:hypothetical protein